VRKIGGPSGFHKFVAAPRLPIFSRKREVSNL
jgi:hypothetical protein